MENSHHHKCTILSYVTPYSLPKLVRQAQRQAARCRRSGFRECENAHRRIEQAFQRVLDRQAVSE